jgi:hypothetical protein
MKKPSVPNDSTMIPAKDIEALVEKDALAFLKSIGINAKKMPTGQIRTPDYAWGKIGIEVTAVHDFSPSIPELDSIRRFLLKNPGNDYYVYTYGNESGLQCRVLRKQKCQNSLSILRVRQHVSTYRKKIVNKLDDKYAQGVGYETQVVLLDFRTAPFDSYSIGKEFAEYLDKNGMNYSELAGVILAVSADPLTSVIKKANYFYIMNPHAKFRVAELDKCSSIPGQTEKINPHPIELFIHNAGKESIVLQPPTFISWEEIESMGLPT